LVEFLIFCTAFFIGAAFSNLFLESNDMSWSGGTEIFDSVVGNLIEETKISDEGKSKIIYDLYDILNYHGWDNLGESTYFDHELVKQAVLRWEKDRNESYSQYDNE
jgi:hypothetical protein